MTFVVPFDGSTGSEAALVRACEIGEAMGATVVAVTVVPTGNTDYARSKGWLDAAESFDSEAIVARLTDQVMAAAPDATFEHLESSRDVSGNSIAKPIRRFARDNGASMVFIGSNNTGRLTTSLSSVGDRISTDQSYDVVIVRQQRSA